MDPGVTDRQSQIIEILTDRSRPVAIPEVARRLGCSERTVQRDVEVLRRLAVEITTEPGRSGGLLLKRPLASSAKIGRSNSGDSPGEPSSAVAHSPGDEFVGRSEESTQLDHALDAAVSGQGRIAIVLGEPGIGKTRTVRELSSRAEARGARTVWGRCRDVEGTPPYWPWTQVVRSLMQSKRSNDEIASADLAIIAALVPELAGLAPEAEPDTGSTTDGSQFQLFDSFTRLLKASAATQPLVIVLDDLHWADQASLGLLQYVSGELESTSLMVLGTARNIDPTVSGPLAASLAELSRMSGFGRLDLEGLTREEIGQLISPDSPPAADSTFADEVFAATEGNPFFAIEMSRLYVTESNRPGPAARLALPDAVREVIERRLSGLPDECVAVLTVGAVLGYQFEFEKLRAVSEADSDDSLLDLMDDALDARVVSEVDGMGLAYEFGHALIHRFLYDGLSAGRRIRLHARAAEDLERSHGDNAAAHAPELAHHFMQASSLIGIEKAVKYSALAGEQALAAYAPESALEHLHMAIAAKKEQPDDLETAELLSSLMIAQDARGEHLDDAVDAQIRAFEIFESEGEISRAIKVAYFGFARSFGGGTRQIALCERGLALTEPGSAEAARISVELGAALSAAGQFERSVEVLEGAIDIARRLEEILVEAHALGNLSFTLLGAHDNISAVKAAEEMLKLAYRVQSGNSQKPLGHRMAAIAFMRMGEAGEAKPHIDKLVELAYASPDRAKADWDSYWACTVALAEGRWDEARRMAGRRDSHHPTMFKFGPDVQIEFMTGDEHAAMRDLVDHLERARDMTGRAPRSHSVGEFALMLAIAGRVTGNSEAFDLAEDAARWLGENYTDMPELASLSIAIRSVCAVGRGDSAASEELYGRYKRSRGSVSITSATRFIIPDRILALLATTADDPNMAARHFVEAIAFSKKAGFRVEQAWAYHDYAAFRLDQGGRIDRIAILEMLSDALEITESLGMEPLRQRLEDLRDSVQANSGRPAYPDGLTQREVEVLRLVAAGNSNRDIADELVITENTAAKHVANILGKTGSANRAEAATYANQQGLVESRD